MTTTTTADTSVQTRNYDVTEFVKRNRFDDGYNINADQVVFQIEGTRYRHGFGAADREGLAPYLFGLASVISKHNFGPGPAVITLNYGDTLTIFGRRFKVVSHPEASRVHGEHLALREVTPLATSSISIGAVTAGGDVTQVFGR